MSQDLWNAVDAFIVDTVVGHDPVLEGALEAAQAAGMPAISVSPAQGKLLYLLARLQGSRNILEVGTLAGYSTIWLARAMPRYGRLITLELDPNHASVARENIARAGFGDVVDVRVGAAMDLLTEMTKAKKEVPYDFVFIDADKKSIPEYFQLVLKLSKPGTVIVVDNVVRDGNLSDANTTDESVLAVRRFHEILSHERRVSATTLQTVGVKGYDGFSVVMVHE
jgi:predicted O-methyltransferase YrrM